MARQDIRIDPGYGEIKTTDNLSRKIINSFTLLPYVEGLDNDYYVYGEIEVDKNYDLKQIEKSLIIPIPYLPISKILKVRIYKDMRNGLTEYVINKTTNDMWFTVIKNKDNKKLYASQFREVSDSGIYNLVYSDGEYILYCSYETDFIISASLKQNEALLLKAFPSNLYQFPRTGVGLVNYLHDHLEMSDLSRKLREEFTNDKMIINDAYMDSETGALLLDVEEM